MMVSQDTSTVILRSLVRYIVHIMPRLAFIANDFTKHYVVSPVQYSGFDQKPAR